MFEPAARSELLARLRSLSPQARPGWGRMTAPQMVAHLSDQMRHTLGDSACQLRGGPLRWAPLRHAVIYWVPWPRGRLKGPPEAFLTQPTSWNADLETLETLVRRFAEREGADTWPEHALLGRMSERDWGAFCHKHFDHHLRQFGV